MIANFQATLIARLCTYYTRKLSVDILTKVWFSGNTTVQKTQRIARSESFWKEIYG